MRESDRIEDVTEEKSAGEGKEDEVRGGVESVVKRN